MKANQLLVTDLDGTLVLDSSSVAADDLHTFIQVSGKYYTAVATGRSIKEIEYIETKNNLHLDYKIGFNGALVVNQDGHILHEQPISENNLANLFHYMKQHHLIFDALDGVVRIGNFQHEKPESLWNMELICLDDPYPALKGRKIYKINLRPEPGRAKQIYQDLTKTFPYLSIYKTGKSRIEITDQNVSKGKALNYCGLDHIVKIIAIGDSENDMSMFQKADVSYCMSHGEQHVKDTATYIIDHFSHVLAAEDL